MDSLTIPTGTTLLGLVLSDKTPPEDDQTIVYQVEPVGDGEVHLHSATCLRLIEENYRNSELVFTTGRELRQSLKDNGVTGLCQDWCLGKQTHATLLVRSCLDTTDRSHLEGADVGLLLYYEAQKPGNVEAWCHWLGRTSTEEAQKPLRDKFGWGEPQNEPYVVCFDAVCDLPFGWVAGLGEHAAVRLPMDNFKVHGLLPQKLAERFAYSLPKTVIPVEPGFGANQFKLAVSLYEEQAGGRIDGQLFYPGAAARAVETAHLALA